MTDFLDAAMPDELTSFEAHLSLCEGCRVYVAQLRRTITVVAESRDTAVELAPTNFDQLVTLFSQDPPIDET